MRKMNVVKLVAVSVLVVSGQSMATPIVATDGLTIGTDTSIIPFVPFAGSPAQSVDFLTYSGRLGLFSEAVESARFANDGGLILAGNPVRVLLENNDVTTGVFEIWKSSDAHTGTTAFPLFSVDGPNTASIFKGVNVSVTKDGTTGGNLAVEGALTVAGKPVVTSAAGAGVALGTGTATGANSLGGGIGGHANSLGTLAWSGTASNFNAIALGLGTTASGINSVAIGQNSVSSGSGSVALAGGTATTTSAIAGAGSTVSGTYSIGSGVGLQSYSYSSAMFGLNNLYVAGNPTTWVATDPLFTLGNGESDTARSTAVATLKNGQTTLTNKYWVPGSPTAPVTTPTGANDGNALVVEGNTVLKGKVTIAAQGDISMGIYAPAP